MVRRGREAPCGSRVPRAGDREADRLEVRPDGRRGSAGGQVLQRAGVGVELVGGAAGDVGQPVRGQAEELVGGDDSAAWRIASAMASSQSSSAQLGPLMKVAPTARGIASSACPARCSPPWEAVSIRVTPGARTVALCTPPQGVVWMLVMSLGAGSAALSCNRQYVFCGAAGRRPRALSRGWVAGLRRGG